MNIFNKFSFNFLDNYYIDIYNDVLNTCNNNYNILFINHNYFNPLNHFSHIIKKYNINIYLIFNKESIIEKISNEIENEECSENIHFNFVDIDGMSVVSNKISFHKIILLHINSINYLNNTLDLIKNFYSNNFELYFYVSLSNKENNYSENKNTIRSFISNNFEYNLGVEFDFDTFLNALNNNKLYKIKKIKLFKETTYIVYGKSNIYKIILNKL